MSVDFSLKGKIALITGASSGLGLHFAQELSDAGASVILAARRTDRLEKTVAEFKAAGREALAVALDVKDSASVKQALAEGCERMGTPDILINNAGVTAPATLLKGSEEQWDHVIDTNLKGVWLVAQETARKMVEAEKGGSIINLASIYAIGTSIGSTSYGASKAGVAHMTLTMAMELARYKIRVNAIAPGWFFSEMNSDYLASDEGKAMIKNVPMRRTGLEGELDGLLLLLASDASSYMTGTTIPVDGGHGINSL
ncbi:MAG: SDR family oxidoreductase [Rhodospirillales bacterium]|nr:SDR family oxidoreductase [Rhodospirillales bacterium]